MLPKIKILDHHEAIKIAAGEVVERPANIVKELIENSIDAGATNISLHMQSAGKELIKITDDGSGMNPQDCKLCFAHHATSKISSVNDLTHIQTYGFRGEALSSIAAVSKVELISKTESDKVATSTKLEFGQFISQTPTSHPTGTTLIISHLFDNVPARKKFLKTDDTEWNLIVTIFQAFCLRYPTINFKLFHNDYMTYNCPATPQIKTRTAQLWNNQLHDQLLEIEPQTQQKITVSGALSNIHYHRFNRGQIFTFVNNRWVKNHELSKAILKGYDGVLPAQKFPAAFLFIDIDPTTIDVNIHPKKEEVKFLHPGILQNLITQIVNKTLTNTLEKTLNTRSDIPLIKNHETAYQPMQNFTVKNAPDFSHFTTSQTNTLLHIPAEQYAQPIAPNTAHQTKPLIKETINETIYQQIPYSIVGQLKKTYIMIEKSEQLVMIDQHAAHERIIYERLKATTGEIARIQLLFPHIVKLTQQQVVALQAHQEIFKQHGILFEPFSDHEIIIQETPIQINAQAAQDILQIVLVWLEKQELNQNDIFTKLYEKILAEKACKAACKAGDTLNFEQMQNLINELEKCCNNFSCPHGRPTMWNLSLKDIQKHFKRDYVQAKQVNYEML